MITYVLYKDVDITKYNTCVDQSYNELLYAYSWYLDSIAERWDVLVLEDYQAVMPLPIRKKFGISYVYLPAWTQQLGIFSKDKIDENLVLEFISAIPNQFKLTDLVLNYQNKISNNATTQRDNFILPMNESYESLFKNFYKGRKSSIKQAKTANLFAKKANNIQILIRLFKENKGMELNKPETDYSILESLVLKGISLKKMAIYEVLDEEKNLLGGAVFLKSKQRITLLFSAMNAQGRKNQAMSFLVDFIIQKYAKQPLILDFEGSMIPEIASFYRSFGAKNQPYYHYKKWQIF